MLRQKLYKLKQEQGVESEPLFPIIKREPVSPSDRYAPRGERGVQASPVGTLPSVARGTSGRHGCHLHPLLFSLPCRLDAEESIVVQPGPSSEPEAEQDVEVKEEAEGEAVLMEEDLIQQSLDDYDAGKYSPRLLGTNELPFDAHVLEAEEDTHRLLLLRQQLQVTGRRTLLGSGRRVCSGVQGWRECCPPGEHEAGPEHAVSGREVCRVVSGTQLSPMDKWVRSFPLPAASLSRTGLQTSRKDIWDAFPSPSQHPALPSQRPALLPHPAPSRSAGLTPWGRPSPLLPAGNATESADDIFFRKAKEGMGADEAQFSVEMPLTGKAYLWADKYRPRKPRFFNRVHTGFEWNKYNQTHYDFDNPPPKIVQGYKFNIFYPDLIDKRSTPEYFLEACQDNKDFAILRFHAGPPYEDIAFKIVNREWEYSHRHGFRCQFANGIFQLWFHFKRYRYRR